MGVVIFSINLKFIKMTMAKKQSPVRKSFGFTLIELMIAVAIISVIAAIAIPAYNGYINEARFATARSNIDSLRLYLEDYRLDNDCYTINCGSNTTYTGESAINNAYGWSPRQDDSDFTYILSVTNTSFTVNAAFTGGWVSCNQNTNCSSSGD